MDYGVAIQSDINEVFVPFINKSYKLKDGYKLNINTFVKSINAMLNGVSHIDFLEHMYKPIIESYVDFAFFCFNNNIFINFVRLEDDDNKGLFRFKESYGTRIMISKPELFSWCIHISGTYIYLCSSDRVKYKYYVVKKRLIASYDEYAFGLIDDYIDNISNTIPASKTRFSFLGVYIFGSEMSFNEDKYYNDLIREGLCKNDGLLMLPYNSKNFDEDGNRKPVGYILEDGVLTPAPNKSDDDDEDDIFSDDDEDDIFNDDDEDDIFKDDEDDELSDSNNDNECHDSNEDTIDINSIDFSNYNYARIPDGEIIVKAIFALILEGTDKPVAIRCKTNFGYYDMNIETALAFGLRIEIIEKGIIVQYINGVYASASERKYNKYVDDISKNKIDCRRLINSVMRRQ